MPLPSWTAASVAFLGAGVLLVGSIGAAWLLRTLQRRNQMLQLSRDRSEMDLRLLSHAASRWAATAGERAHGHDGLVAGATDAWHHHHHHHHHQEPQEPLQDMADRRGGGDRCGAVGAVFSASQAAAGGTMIEMGATRLPSPSRPPSRSHWISKLWRGRGVTSPSPSVILGEMRLTSITSMASAQNALAMASAAVDGRMGGNEGSERAGSDRTDRTPTGCLRLLQGGGSASEYSSSHAATLPFTTAPLTVGTPSGPAPAIPSTILTAGQPAASFGRSPSPSFESTSSELDGVTANIDSCTDSRLGFARGCDEEVVYEHGTPSSFSKAPSEPLEQPPI